LPTTSRLRPVPLSEKEVALSLDGEGEEGKKTREFLGANMPKSCDWKGQHSQVSEEEEHVADRVGGGGEKLQGKKEGGK